MPTSHTSKNMDASVPLNIRIKPATRNLIDRAATCRNTPISTAKAMLSTIEAWLRVTTVFVSTPTKFRSGKHALTGSYRLSKTRKNDM